MMSIEEDKQFLLKQRKKGRPGCILGINKKLLIKEIRSIVNLQKSKNIEYGNGTIK